jgi:hypothetical protein
MGAFEHVTTLIAFVFALAIAHVLSTVISLIRAGARVHYAFTHAVWFITAPVAVLSWWLALYDFHLLRQWNVGLIGLWLMGAVTIYLYTGLVCPEVPKEGPLDLNQFHRAHARQYLAAALAGETATIALGIYGNSASLPDQIVQTAFSLASAVPALIAFFFRQHRVQNICATVQLVSLPLYFLIGQQSLS